MPLVMDQKTEIKEKIDLVSFLAEYLTLKKAGHNFKALCPFHGEKTPSFMISPERQIWHCFGCQKGGDVFTFLMEYEHLEFYEALSQLAEKTGVKLQKGSFDTGLSAKKEKLYQINLLASDFYHYLLTKHKAGERARKYLEQRGVDPKVTAHFKLGFAPTPGTNLSEYLVKKKGYLAEDVVEAGLGFFYGRNLRDFFRGRLIFPLIDHRDHVLGFSGRVLSDKADGPKYINTRETLIYHKKEHIFGIQTAREAIKRENQAVLVEGEFDVIASFQNGIANTVATKGTALTEEQIALLARFAPKITICFDGDKAGQEAVKRSLPLFEKKGILATVVLIPEGKDPAEALNINPLAFKMALKKDVGIYDFLFDTLLKENDPATPEGKKQISSELLPVFARIENEIVKEHYLRRLSSVLDTSYESIAKELEKKLEAKKTVVVPVSPEKIPREEKLEGYLTSLIVQAKNPKEALEQAVKILSGSMSKERAYQKIISHLLSYFAENNNFDSSQFGRTLPPELLPSFDQSFLSPLPMLSDEEYLEEITKAANNLRLLYLKTKIKTLKEKIKKEETKGNETELPGLQKEYADLLSQIRPL